MGCRPLPRRRWLLGHLTVTVLVTVTLLAVTGFNPATNRYNYTVNERFASVEQIKRFVLLGEEWMPDSDVLTPTSKLKRRGVLARYQDRIEGMYA